MYYITHPSSLHASSLVFCDFSNVDESRHHLYLSGGPAVHESQVGMTPRAGAGLTAQRKTGDGVSGMREVGIDLYNGCKGLKGINLVCLEVKPDQRAPT